MNAGEIPEDGIDNDGNGIADDVHGFNATLRNGDPSDEEGHGTHLAGIIGASGNNNKGIAGVAWKVRLMAVKAFNERAFGAASAIADGIQYAIDAGVDIVNASFGSEDDSKTIRQAMERARKDGIVFVATAGLPWLA